MKKLQTIIVTFFALLSFSVNADYLIVGRSATLKAAPDGSGQIIERLSPEDVLDLINQNKVNGYYHARSLKTGSEGWIYQTLVRRYPGDYYDLENVSDEIPPLSLEYILPKSNPGDVVITRDGFTSCMSYSYMLPKWVAHELSAELLQGTAKRSGSGYPKDNLFPDLKSSAYTNSGYDHGHLAPAADFKRSQLLITESNLMTNMTPQHGCMNQKAWCVLESNVRHWARQSPESRFYVISGPILNEFIDSLCIDNTTKVYVPNQFFKVVIEQTSSGQVNSAAFIVPNTDVTFPDLESGRVSVDVLESITGMDVMPKLSKRQASQIESKAFDFKLQDLTECIGRNKSCDAIYSSRTKPEDRTQLICK